MNRFLALFLTLLAGVSVVWANLGDSNDKIEESYGNLVQRRLRDDGTVDIVYHKDKYLYFVTYDKGVSILERYSRVDGRDLSEKEITKFLKANAGKGVTWTGAATVTSNRRKFERSDHKAEATYARMNGRLTLTVQWRGMVITDQ